MIDRSIILIDVSGWIQRNSVNIAPVCLCLQVFNETCAEIFITPNNAQTMFVASLQSLFSDGVINWGRVVALLAFSGSLAAQCVEKEMPFLVNQVIDWTTAYISTNLASWIHDNGGWVSRPRVL